MPKRDQSSPDPSITMHLNDLADPSRAENAARILFPRVLQMGSAIANVQHIRQSDAASVVPTEVTNLLEKVRLGTAAFPNRVALARYLAMTLRSRSIDRARSRKRLRSLSQFMEGGTIEEHHEDDLAPAQNEETLVAECNRLDERLAAGLEQSHERTRRAIRLFLEGFSKIEIAAQLGVVPSTVTVIFQQFAVLVATEIGDDA